MLASFPGLVRLSLAVQNSQIHTAQVTNVQGLGTRLCTCYTIHSSLSWFYETVVHVDL